MMAVGEMYAYATQESSGDIRIQGPMYFREEVWWLRTNLEEAAQTHTTLRKTSNSCPYQSSIQSATTISPHPRDGHKKGEKGATDSLDSSICLCLGYQIQPSKPCSFELYQRHHSLIGQLEPQQVDYPLVRFIRGSRLDSSVRGNGVHHQHASVLFFLTRALADERLKRSAIQP